MISVINVPIGGEVFYMDGSQITTSIIIKATLQSLTPTEEEETPSEVIIELQSGVVMPYDRACFSVEELYQQLNADFIQSRA